MTATTFKTGLFTRLLNEASQAMKTGTRVFKLVGSMECVVRVKGQLYRTHTDFCQKPYGLGYVLDGVWSPRRRGIKDGVDLTSWLKSLPWLEGVNRGPL
jgi:hypothetical protein